MISETTITFALAGCLVALGYLLRVTRESSLCRSADALVTKKDLQEMERRMVNKLSELEGKLIAVNNTLEKVKNEVQALKDALEDVELPEGAQAALDKLTATADAIDALNPDAPAPPSEP